MPYLTNKCLYMWSSNYSMSMVYACLIKSLELYLILLNKFVKFGMQMCLEIVHVGIPRGIPNMQWFSPFHCNSCFHDLCLVYGLLSYFRSASSFLWCLILHPALFTFSLSHVILVKILQILVPSLPLATYSPILNKKYLKINVLSLMFDKNVWLVFVRQVRMTGSCPSDKSSCHRPCSVCPPHLICPIWPDCL